MLQRLDHLRTADTVNKVSLKDSPSKTAKAGSFRGCKPWTETKQMSPVCFSPRYLTCPLPSSLCSPGPRLVINVSVYSLLLSLWSLSVCFLMLLVTPSWSVVPFSVFLVLILTCFFFVFWAFCCFFVSCVGSLVFCFFCFFYLFRFVNNVCFLFPPFPASRVIIKIIQTLFKITDQWLQQREMYPVWKRLKTPLLGRVPVSLCWVHRAVFWFIKQKNKKNLWIKLWCKRALRGRICPVFFLTSHKPQIASALKNKKKKKTASSHPHRVFIPSLRET